MFHALIFMPWQYSGSYFDKTEFTLAIDHPANLCIWERTRDSPARSADWELRDGF